MDFVLIPSYQVQVVCDIIQSRGTIGGPYVRSELRTGEPVKVFFCNPDLVWRSDFERPRLGQGAFKEAFQAVYKVCCPNHDTAEMVVFTDRLEPDWFYIPVHTVWEAHSRYIHFRRECFGGTY